MAQHRKVPLDYDLLHDLYVVKKYTTTKMAERFGCSRAAVESALKAVKIPVTRQRVPRDRALLHRLYMELGMTAEEIANYFGVDKQTVLNALRDVGIPIRKKGYDPVYKKYADWNDATVQQIFLGSLLGDGGLYLGGRSNRVVQYREGHSLVQKNYVAWKNDYYKFKYDEPGRSASKQVPEKGISSYIYSWSHPYLDSAYKNLYGGGKRRVSDILAGLGDLGLLVWYLDDATYWPYPLSIYFYVNGFSHEEHEIMCDWFEKKYSIRPGIGKYNNHGNDPERKAKGILQEKLTLYGDRARTLLGVIRPQFVKFGLPVDMSYKMCPLMWHEDTEEIIRHGECMDGQETL